MKLKAIVEEPKMLFDIFDLCRRMQQHCTLSLQASTTRVFTSIEHHQDAAQVWVECKTEHLLRAFRCQSPYPHNAIVCDILDTRHLCQVLKNAERLRGEGYGREVRLSKQMINGQASPLLTFTFRSPKGVKQERNDIPIQLRSHAEMEALHVPSVEEEESVHVVMPHMSELFHFVETLRSVRGCDHIFFHSRVHSASGRSGHTSSSSSSSLSRMRMHRGTTNDRATNSSNDNDDGEEEEDEKEDDDEEENFPSSFASLEVEANHPYASLRLRYGKVQRIPPPPYDAEDTEEEEEDDEEDRDEGGDIDTGEIKRRTSDGDLLPGKKREREGSCTRRCPSRVGGSGEEDEEKKISEKRRGKRKKKVFIRARSEAQVTISVKKFVPFISAIRSLDLSALSIHLVHEQALVFCFSHARCARVAAYLPAVVPEVIGG